MLEFFKEKSKPSEDPFKFDDDLEHGVIFKIENLTYSAPHSMDKSLVQGNVRLQKIQKHL